MPQSVIPKLYRRIQEWLIMDERAMINPDDAMVLEALDGDWKEAEEAADAQGNCVICPVKDGKVLDYIKYTEE